MPSARALGAVILMVSVGRGAEKRSLDRIDKPGTNLVVVNAAPARLMIGRQLTAATVTTITAAAGRALAEECPRIIAAAPAVSKSLVGRWESNNTTMAVLGKAAEEMLNLNLAEIGVKTNTRVMAVEHELDQDTLDIPA
jgi:putative ABC transport system permease protein